ncbi:GvpL/GvpF family gas vesicle protein [Sinomonas albida]|uniref:GvpL/GvpF family gas vesicle protein n=1 Tax=Sinomonas albida TaxID=369942 RepID=UPI0010A75294|nr:GvpL/GvpF family gas vesicle protein [Sinomonas albida]
MSGQRSSPEEAAGLYVYAIVPADLDPATLGAGIDAQPLELVTVAEGVAAVVHRHDAPPYAGSDRDAERRVLEHGNVAERCWAHAGTVLPMGFNVIVTRGEEDSARERLAEWLRHSAPALVERLAALHGGVELRVEISLDEQAAARESPEARQLEEDLRTRPPGVQRLLRKKLATLVRQEAEARADHLYPGYRRRLAGLSRDVAENLRGHPPEGYVTVLNVSLLASREEVPRIGGELTDIQAEDPAVRVQFLGPWPPFSFASMPNTPRAQSEPGTP